MSYYDVPPPESPLRLLARAALSRAPSYASLAFTSGTREALSVARNPGFRNTRGEMVTPPSTQLRVGPVILTVVWGRAASTPDQAEEVGGYDAGNEEV